MNTSSSCQSKHKTSKGIFKRKLFWISFLSVVFANLTWFYPPWKGIAETFFKYLGLLWWPILLGIFVGGLIDHFVPQEAIQHYLSRKKKRTILYAVGFGFLMSVCSHGILAIAMTLYKKKASISSVIAFLLASPWANLPITIILFGFFGMKAILFIGVAIVIALTTGLIFQYLESWGWIEQESGNQTEKDDYSVVTDICQRWQRYQVSSQQIKQDLGAVLKSMMTLINMVLWWILLGIVIAALARTLIPHHLFSTYMGPNFSGLLVTLLLATIIEICSEGSAPLAFELYHHTHAFGNVLVFLMAGVVTDYTEIGLLWSNIGKRTAIMLPLVTIPQVLAWGFLLNYWVL